MFCSRLSTTLLLAAACLLMRAGFSRAQMSGGYDDRVSTEKVVTCDDLGNVHHLSCDSGFIRVQTALYGRADSETCSEGRPPHQLTITKCSQNGTLDVLKKKCDGKRVCEINTNAFHSSDPCVGTYKYLESTYTCFPATHIVACEHSLANLKCNGWQVIIVYGAYYGRRDRTTCSYQRPFYQTLNARCSNPTSKVAESCNGKSSCDIKVSNSVFGDPCAFTYKYLEVVYGCHYWFRLAA